MTATVSPDPAPKATMPPLDARAPRPPIVRLRRGVVVGLTMGGASLVAGALAWAFVLQPALRAQAHAAPRDPSSPTSGEVRPSERVTGGPSTYAQLDQLPAPRRLGATSIGAPPPSSPSPRAAAAPGATLGADARSSSLFFADAAHSAAAPATSSPASPGVGTPGDYAAVYNAHELLAPLSPFEVKAGAILPATLLTAIDTSRAGPVVAAVSENVFDSTTGRSLLIPQGARLIGQHEGESRYGDKRVVIVWDRLILPNGKSLVLSKQPGVDAQGAVGVTGEVDRRLAPLVVATLFSGAVTAVGETARDHTGRGAGLLGDAGDAASIEAAQVGGKLIDRELDVHPVIRLRQGERVRVLITRDLVLEPYRP